MLPAPVQLYIEQWLIDTMNGIRPTLRCTPVGGGSINQAYRIETGKYYFFCKINAITKYPSLFANEQKGLVLLAKQQVIRVPQVLAIGEAGDYQVLVLEWIEQGLRTDSFWKNFGEQLAALHQKKGAQFGLDTDNYMGSLPQYNTPATSWTDFFIHCRLQPQIELALANRLLEPAHIKMFEKLYVKLPDLFNEEPPCLLHGDLWSGNYLCSEDGWPVLIDPAVYYGHRSIDLAMTTLFGGFSEAFYASYHYHYPLPVNYRQQWGVCNLYPLLVHLNLFGKSYLADILHTIRNY